MRRTISDPEKKVVAARQGWRCSACCALLPAAFQVDHTISLAAGGEDSIRNCTAMCPNCHAEKTQLEAIARHHKAVALRPTYEERADIFLTPTLIKCSLCSRTRHVSLDHNICTAIETPDLHSIALKNRLSQFAFVRRTRQPPPLPDPAAGVAPSTLCAATASAARSSLTKLSRI